MATKERLREIIARRILNIPGRNRRVTVVLGCPQQILESGQTLWMGDTSASIPKGEWICPFKITGLPESDELAKSHIKKIIYYEAWGHDSLDSLLLALRTIGAILDKCNPPLHWTWSWGFDPGFPIMTEIYGLENKREMEDKFERVVQRSMKKYAGRPRPA